jgi:hypothetical protein
MRPFDRKRLLEYARKWGHRGVSAGQVHGQITSGGAHLTSDEIRFVLDEAARQEGWTVRQVLRPNKHGVTTRIYHATPAPAPAPPPVPVPSDREPCRRSIPILGRCR